MRSTRLFPSETLGIVFLPSGPGLSSGPARGFLEPVFAGRGPYCFWHEPSLKRGDSPSPDPTTRWNELFDSIASAVESLPGDFVFVTESFGSVLAEEFVRRRGTQIGARRLRGILHTPPVLDLFHAFRTILRRGAVNYRDDAKPEWADRLEAASAFTRLDDPALFKGLDFAFSHPAVMAAYFRQVEGMAKWMDGFAASAADAPDNSVRDAILTGLEAAGADVRLRLDSPVLTEVCVGALDPYGPVQPPANPIRWTIFPDSSHYPYVDQPDLWATEILDPFLARARAT